MFRTIFKYLRPAVYTYKQDNNLGLSEKKTFGIMAQDVQQGFLAEGLDWRDYSILTRDKEGNFMVDYSQLIPLLIKEIHVLQDRVQELEDNVSTED
jgi:hypothetical protein